jgi:hypothetical protein
MVIRRAMFVIPCAAVWKIDPARPTVVRRRSFTEPTCEGRAPSSILIVDFLGMVWSASPIFSERSPEEKAEPVPDGAKGLVVDQNPSRGRSTGAGNTVPWTAFGSRMPDRSGPQLTVLAFLVRPACSEALSRSVGPKLTKRAREGPPAELPLGRPSWSRGSAMLTNLLLVGVLLFVILAVLSADRPPNASLAA